MYSITIYLFLPISFITVGGIIESPENRMFYDWNDTPLRNVIDQLKLRTNCILFYCCNAWDHSWRKAGL